MYPIRPDQVDIESLQKYLESWTESQAAEAVNCMPFVTYILDWIHGLEPDEYMPSFACVGRISFAKRLVDFYSKRWPGSFVPAAKHNIHRIAKCGDALLINQNKGYGHGVFVGPEGMLWEANHRFRNRIRSYSWAKFNYNSRVQVYRPKACEVFH
tara:strand:- start:8449 stop:8913 length:465 start_codon:yes stop_codon:yes gene_type:complete